MAHVEMRIVDRDLRILRQLNTKEYRRVADARSGGISQRLRALVSHELLVSKRGRYGGYKLARPLSEMHLSYWLNMLMPHDDSPTMKLLRLFEYTPVSEILSYTVYRGLDWTMQLDHVIGILSRLSSDRFTLPRTLDYPELDDGYLAHIYTRLSDHGIIHRIPRKGAILSRAYDTITVEDVLPLVSHNCLVLSALMTYASGVRLASLHTTPKREYNVYKKVYA